MGLRAMKVFFKFAITFLMITIGISVSAGSIWDGSVSTARYGYLPQTGLYAASNAFPQNSRVTVTNPNTGKKVDVLILERLEDNNLFLVLSTEAAESIGISYGDIFYGNISEQDNNISSRDDELPYNPDPDVNPSAGSDNFSELELIQNYIEELGGSDDILLISDIADPTEQIPDTTITEAALEFEVEEDIIDETIAVLEPDSPEIVEVIPEIEEDAPLASNMPMEEVYISESDNILSLPEVVLIPEKVIEEAVDPIEEDIPVLVSMSTDVPVLVTSADIRNVLPELPVPESDIPVVTVLESGVIEGAGDGTTDLKLPELPIIGVEIVEIPEEETPVATIMAIDIVPVENEEKIDHLLPELVKVTDEPEAPLEIVLAKVDPEIVIPEEDIVVSDTFDTPENIEVEVVLEPSNLRPPVPADEPETEIVEIKTTETEEIPISPVGNYNITKVLAEDFYYLQLGAYREQYSALDLAGRLGVTYPVTVLVSESSDNLNYKVMVGPLGQDESGVILYSFKSTGYPDAFLRKGL